MAKFYVSVPVNGLAGKTIEANTKEEALEKAYDEIYPELKRAAKEIQ